MTNQISNVPKIRYQIVCLLSNSHFSALILWKLAAFCVERPYSFASRNRSRFAFLEKILSQAKNRVNKRGGLRRLSFFYFSSLPLSCFFSSSISSLRSWAFCSSDNWFLWIGSALVDGSLTLRVLWGGNSAGFLILRIREPFFSVKFFRFILWHM